MTLLRKRPTETAEVTETDESDEVTDSHGTRHPTLGKRDLVRRTATRANVSQVTVDAVIKHMTDIIGETLAEGARVSIAGFIRLDPVDRPNRTYTNPRPGGGVIEVPAHRAIRVKALTRLRRRVRG